MTDYRYRDNDGDEVLIEHDVDRVYMNINEQYDIDQACIEMDLKAMNGLYEWLGSTIAEMEHD